MSISRKKFRTFSAIFVSRPTTPPGRSSPRAMTSMTGGMMGKRKWK